MVANSAALPALEDFAAPTYLSFPLDSKTNRAPLTVADVKTYITKQINRMPKNMNVTSLQSQLINNLTNAYGNQNNWLVLVAQNFKPPKENVSINYFGKGITSNVIVGSWTVYWAATPKAPTDTQRMVVNQDLIKSQLSNCSSIAKGQFTASMVYKCLENSPKPVTSGRSPIAKFVFISSSTGPNTSIGGWPWLNKSTQSIIIIIIVRGPVVVIIVLM